MSLLRYIELHGDDEAEVEIVIDSYTPYSPGRRGNIDDWEPDYDEEVEITVFHNGLDVTEQVSDSQLADFKDDAIAHLKECQL